MVTILLQIYFCFFSSFTVLSIPRFCEQSLFLSSFQGSESFTILSHEAAARNNPFRSGGNSRNSSRKTSAANNNNSSSNVSPNDQTPTSNGTEKQQQQDASSSDSQTPNHDLFSPPGTNKLYGCHIQWKTFFLLEAGYGAATGQPDDPVLDDTLPSPTFVTSARDSSHLSGLVADLSNGGLVVLEFVASWCGLCAMIAPQIEVRTVCQGKFLCSAHFISLAECRC